MTIEIGYLLDDEWASWKADVDLATAGPAALEYECFLGDAILRFDGCDLSATWGWVPILHFAVGIEALVGDGGDVCVYQFTESDAQIKIERVMQEELVFTADYADCEAHISRQEAVEAARRFRIEFVEQMQREFPALTRNINFEAYV